MQVQYNNQQSSEYKLFYIIPILAYILWAGHHIMGISALLVHSSDIFVISKVIVSSKEILKLICSTL